MLDLRNLTKFFDDKVVLNDINLQLTNPSSLYVLTGESGSGKTTLFNILFGLDNDYQGNYKLFGKDSKAYKNQDWDHLRTNEIKMVFQDFKLFEQLTVYENLYLSGDYKREDIYSVLESMDLLELKDEVVKNISGGQKQRVAIGRAVLGSPKIILLDEPTGNLDGMTTNKIMVYISKLKNKGISFFVITHDDSILEYADIVFKLENGKITQTYSKNEHEYVETKQKSLQTEKTKQKKHVLLYTFLSVFRKMKRIFLLGVPIVIILMLFILSFTAFQAASLDSFTNFFSGVDNKSIVFSTQKLTSEVSEDLKKNNILASHDGERIGFSNEDIKKVENIQHIDKIELTVEGIQSFYDHEGNRFEYRLDYENIPAFLRKDLVQIRNGESITFTLTAQNVPSSVIHNYNFNNINIISGEFPKDGSKEILIPDLYAFMISESENNTNLINSTIELDVTSPKNNLVNEEYKIVGIYDTGYRFNLSPSYPIYVGYFPQNDIQDKLNEEAYQFHVQAYKINRATEEYSENIIKDLQHYKQAMGTGFDQMIVVVDHEENFDSVYNELKNVFPKYQFISQYDLKNGDLSYVYHSLIRNLVVGSIIIAVIIGLVVIFLNKGYIFDRTKEFAILFCQGFSKRDIIKIISLENGLIFTIYFLIAYLLAFLIDFIFLNTSKYGHLFLNLLTFKNVVSLSLLVIIIVSISIIWGVKGIKNNNLVKLLKD
ncbi:ABC transporter ATP-binding protein YtrE [Paraliobacillus sp. PM-2]|uniref:ABC transporter ATP-binding protein/permease n=1 Tax=Paraliobacillus sp. PM-2 TaxID=1462524 RepID=UPI00061CCAD8|nr:ATP-binding cassette domain-containing protein [Paraliobacillus sp. PM-2]CQR47967.1 ABC transporter ATP-binding protein YtrE [Paraliobacillus sp. PM-2]